MGSEITNIKNILFVEDDPGDVELTLEALQENRLANRVVVVTEEEAPILSPQVLPAEK